MIKELRKGVPCPSFGSAPTWITCWVIDNRPLTVFSRGPILDYLGYFCLAWAKTTSATAGGLCVGIFDAEIGTVLVFFVVHFCAL